MSKKLSTPDTQPPEKGNTPIGVRYSPEMGDRLIEIIKEVGENRG